MDSNEHEQPPSASVDEPGESDNPDWTPLLVAGGHLLAGAATVTAWTTTGRPSRAAGFLGMGCLLAVPVVVDRQSLRAGRGLSWRPTVTSWALLAALAIRTVTVGH